MVRVELALNATRPANFLFFDVFPTILLRSDFYINDRAWFTVLD
jgi:hypothetical protein